MTSTVVDLVCRACSADTVPDAAGRAVDHVALCTAAHALGSALAARGIGREDRIACALGGEAELAVALIAAASIRAALVPVTLPADEAVLRAHGVTVVLATPDGRPSTGARTLRVELDDRALLRVDGEEVFESHAGLAEPDDLPVILPDGRRLTQSELVGAADGRGLEGLLDVLRTPGLPLERAA